MCCRGKIENEFILFQLESPFKFIFSWRRPFNIFFPEKLFWDFFPGRSFDFFFPGMASKSFSLYPDSEPALIPGRIRPGNSGHSGLAQSFPSRAPAGLCPYAALGHITWYGPQGFVWARAGSSGLPVRDPIKFMSKPGQIPHNAQTGLGRGRLGLPAQIPHGPRPGWV